MTLVSGLVLSVITIVAFMLPSIYQSTAILMIEEQHIPSDFVMTTVNTYAEQRVENIKQRVLSFTQLSEIINRHNLYSDLKEKWTPEELVNKMRGDIKVQTISAEMIDRRTGRPTAVTTAFTVSYEGKNPRAVLQVTDTLSSRFMEQNLKKRQQQVEDTSLFLASEVGRIKTELARAERALAGFKEQHINELPELFQVNMQSLSHIEQNIERLNSELRSLRERESYLDVQLASISPFQSNLEEGRREQQSLNELRIQLASLQQKYTEHYPDILTLKAQIRELEQRSTYKEPPPGITNNGKMPDNPAYITLKSQLASTTADVKSVKEQIISVEKQAEVYRRRIQETPRVEEKYQALVSQRNSLQAKYNDLVQKHQEARVAQELEQDQKGERFTLIEPARLPEKPAKPNRKAIVLIGMVLALGSSIGFAALREVTDQTVGTTEALAILTGGPVLMGMPKIVTREDKRKKRLRIIMTTVVILAVICSSIVLFHIYIMDLHIFWAKVVRKLAMY